MTANPTGFISESPQMSTNLSIVPPSPADFKAKSIDSETNRAIMGFDRAIHGLVGEEPMSASSEKRGNAAHEIMLKLTRIDGTLANVGAQSRGAFTVLIVLLVINILALALLGMLFWTSNKTSQDLPGRLDRLTTKLSELDGKVGAIAELVKERPATQAQAGVSIDPETMKALQGMLKNTTDLYKDLGVGGR